MPSRPAAPIPATVAGIESIAAASRPPAPIPTPVVGIESIAAASTSTSRPAASRQLFRYPQPLSVPRASRQLRLRLLALAPPRFSRSASWRRSAMPHSGRASSRLEREPRPVPSAPRRAGYPAHGWAARPSSRRRQWAPTCERSSRTTTRRRACSPSSSAPFRQVP